MTRPRGGGQGGASSFTGTPLVIISNASIYRDYRLVIRNLDWTLNRGEHGAVFGANGSGKSTLLNLLYGDLHPVLGRYFIVGLNNPPNAADCRAAQRWLEFFGIESLRDRGPRQVSHGQMRPALIARAMVNNPELLLLDEPCTGLDRDVRTYVLSLLQRQCTASNWDFVSRSTQRGE